LQPRSCRSEHAHRIFICWSATALATDMLLLAKQYVQTHIDKVKIIALCDQPVRSLEVLTCECSETCIIAMHVVGQDDLISIAQFDLDQHQNISSPQTECNSLLSLCPYIKHNPPHPWSGGCWDFKCRCMSYPAQLCHAETNTLAR
jgi:hypothetical protein